MRILVGYDGSKCADAALVDLRRSGLPREGEALIVSVAEMWMPAPLRPVSTSSRNVSAAVGAKPSPEAAPGEALLTKARTLALKAAEQVKSFFPEWEVTAEGLAGSPAREILRATDKWKPDLLVVGCQGCSKLGRFLLGSVSQKVVNEARCSVRIVRGLTWKNGSPARILIGVDGSDGSITAVKAVAKRVWPRQSEARLITVCDPDGPPNTRDTGPGAHGATSWITDFVEKSAARLRAVELCVSSKIEQGDPKRVLIASAEEWGADCIFLGANGCAGEVALGSVSTGVVSRAHCSVEVVRPD